MTCFNSHLAYKQFLLYQLLLFSLISSPFITLSAGDKIMLSTSICILVSLILPSTLSLSLYPCSHSLHPHSTPLLIPFILIPSEKNPSPSFPPLVTAFMINSCTYNPLFPSLCCAGFPGDGCVHTAVAHLLLCVGGWRVAPQAVH